MKKIMLMAGVAVFAITGATASMARGYDKDNDHSMDRETRYAIPDDHAQLEGSDDYADASTYKSQPRSAAPENVEPSSGAWKHGGENHDYKDMFKDFTGPYFGGDIGYNISSVSVEDPSGPDGDVGLTGWEGGLFVGYGYTYDFGWLGGYAGLEAGYEWSGADGDLGSDSYEKNHAWLITLRPGIAMHEDALAYGIIGYSRANFESGSADDDLNGLVVGAGSEFSTRSPAKIRLEYTYTNYDDGDLHDVNFESQENQIKVGLVLRF